MALQYSEAVRNAQLNALETTIGTGAILRVYTGSPPADCATAASGTLLVSMTLDSDWMAAASGGSKAKTGTWSGTASGGSGSTPGYWRLWDSGVSACGAQGTAAIGSGDMNFDGTITSGQTVTVSTFTISAANS
jgi:hypothetical protein